MCGFIRLSAFGLRALFMHGFQVCLCWALLYCLIAYVRLTKLCMLGLNRCLHWVETFASFWMETILHLGFKPLFILSLPKNRLCPWFKFFFGLNNPVLLDLRIIIVFIISAQDQGVIFSIEQLILAVGFPTACSCGSIPTKAYTKGLSTLWTMMAAVGHPPRSS